MKKVLFMLVILGLTAAGVQADQFIKGGPNNSPVLVKSVCEGGYLFVVAVTSHGVDIEQVMQEFQTTLAPVMCESPKK